MDFIRNKYANFIAFIKENLHDSSYLAVLSTVSVETFLKKLQEEAENYQTAWEIADRILEKCNINKASYPPEVYDKFVRYIEYFLQIAYIIVL